MHNGNNGSDHDQILYQPSTSTSSSPIGLHQTDQDLRLHEAILTGNKASYTALLESGIDPNSTDVHGNTPLHLAAMTGNHDAIVKLLNRGASTSATNNNGWNILAEAVSYGNRRIIKTILVSIRKEKEAFLKTQHPEFSRLFQRLVKDFYMEIKWDFHTWIPFVSRWMPSDICKIYKRGNCLRVDSSLVDFSRSGWERGDLSLVFNASPSVDTDTPTKHNEQKQFVLNNVAKTYQYFNVAENKEFDLDAEIDSLMSSDIVSANISTKTISFAPQKSGYFFNSSKPVGGMATSYFSVDGLYLVTKKRREHLTADDIKNNKFVKQFFTDLIHGKSRETDSGVENDGEQKPSGSGSRRSLPKPPKTQISWDEYLALQSGHIGRTLNEKIQRKEFKCLIGMSHEFPLQLSSFVDLLEVITVFKHVQKLRKFMTAKLPPGFPVHMEIPLLPMLSAKIQFTRFEWRDNLDSNLFKIPEDYTLSEIIRKDQ